MNFQIITGVQQGAIGALVKAFPWETLPQTETLIVLEFGVGRRDVFRAKDLAPSQQTQQKLPSGLFITIACGGCGKPKEIEANRAIAYKHYRCYQCKKAARKNGPIEREPKYKPCPYSDEKLLKLYETLSLAQLARRIRVGKGHVRQWILDAGGTIRPQGGDNTPRRR